ncbi:MAG TPA: metal ABC transporter permease [Candidatus Saccharimonadales bacterium]|nr:metal ABC transporter permease [Candidatus Saccharimonadales bacterium]
MPELFQYDFMLRGLIAGLLIATTVPVLGNFLVARRYSLIADSLAHVSLAGVGAGLLLGFAPLVMAVPVTIAGGILLEWLRQRQGLSGEVSLAILMSGGLAVAVVLANLAKEGSVDFTSYLFGSITTTSKGDVLALGVATLAVLVIVALNYRAFLHISFDEDSARISGYRVTLLNYLLAAMTAALAVLSLRIVGGLLISALLVIPVIIASKFARGFLQNILLSICVAAIAVVVGLTVAFYAGIAAGGAIVLTAIALLVLSILWQGKP